ncbi:hypothetical protein Zmor_025624 [Zophobas morio]|uniref:Replication protein A subunit n=1 Tax=Zophobas morio TaxID=2755281 RepID=A0AA38M3W3_9CUCU|nr:hypothetical protein Zmor_025624 [Zophobas morio]
MNRDCILSEGVLEKIMNGATIPYPVLQVLGSKKMVSNNIKDSERLRLLLSDGKYKINVAMFTVPANSQDALELYSVIKLIRYFSNVIRSKDKRDMRVLIILELELIYEGRTVGRTIGDPTTLTDNEFPTSQSSDSSNFAGSSITLYRRKNENGDLFGDTKTISPIASLNPFHNNWIIKARVINKTSIRHWCNSRGEGKLFSCDLVDRSGEIRCTAFKELADKFYECLNVDKVYYISRCLLQPINRQFCNLKHDFEMTTTPETQVEECLDDDLLIPKVNYNFTTLDKVAAMVGGTIVDVIAVCKSVSELQTFTSKSTNRDLKKKEVLLVDQSKTGICLTLWGMNAESFNHSDQPVVSLKNAKICEFRGNKTITPVMGSLLKVNPDIPDAYKLRKWFDLDGNQVEFNNVSAKTTIGNVPWMTFKEAQRYSQDHGDQGFYFQTYATILLIRVDRAVYKSCPTPECQKKVIDLENGMYRCEKCNREYPEFKYRFLVSMNVSDMSGSQWVTLFSAEAEKILAKTAQEIGEAMEHDQESVGKLFDEVQFKQFLFKIRAKMESYNDEQKLRMIVVSTSPITFEDHNAYLIKKIEELRG